MSARQRLPDRKRKLPLGWRRQPSPDCPICQGEGQITINVYGPCGAKENTAPLRGSCPCVQIGGRRPDRHTLERMREEMIAVEAQADGSTEHEAITALFDPKDAR